MAEVAWSRVKDVLSGALDEPVSEREAFLDRACGDDGALRAEVEALIAEAEADECPIERHVASYAPMARLGPLEGTRLGQYELVRELGRGGMGTVFLARRVDGQFDHHVAIKVIRQAFLRDHLEEQFRRERQILATLTHPNIARLLDGGISDQDELFAVMEYVEGEPLLAYVNRVGLSVRDRLALFVRVCGAVAYAHSKLVVHRDLKPSNILVTADGDPRLVDFGLAKVVDDTLSEDGGLQTVAGFRAFTPAYAAPEQIGGEPVTTAADIYSLGVVLSELLTGAKPFDVEHKSVSEIVRILGSTTPAKPSELVGARPTGVPSTMGPATTGDLRGDLDNIVLTAVERDPQARYGSVSALADDVERFLHDRPVLARPQTAVYRLRKFVSRHRIAVAASAVMVVALAAALVLALWQAQVARQERDRATRRFDDVRRLANDLLFELGPRIERLRGATEAREVLLARALTYLDSLSREAAGDIGLRLELAAAYEKIGDLQGNPTNPNLVALDASIASYEKAQQLRRAALEQGAADRASRRQLAENHRVLGTVYAQANDFERSTQELNAALSAYERLAAEDPADADLNGAIARVLHDLGRNESNTKRYRNALPYFERAIAMAGRARAQEPRSLPLLTLVADTHSQNGLALSWEGRQREAEAEMSRAASLLEPAATEYPDDTRVSGGLWSVYWVTSTVYEEQDDRKSHVFASRALDVARAELARDPANERARQQVARSLSRLGQTSTNIGQQAEALGYLEEACANLRALASGDVRNGRLRSDLALALTRLADAKAKNGMPSGAVADATEAIAVYEGVVATTPDDKRSVRNLVLAHQLMGDIQGRLAEQAREPIRQRARALAGASYQQAVTLLERLEADGALAAVDKNFLAKLQARAATYRADPPARPAARIP
jgi:non-specific serine/threonine protein kinase/serine/threonine-protein kinase